MQGSYVDFTIEWFGQVTRIAFIVFEGGGGMMDDWIILETSMCSIKT